MMPVFSPSNVAIQNCYNMYALRIYLLLNPKSQRSNLWDSWLLSLIPDSSHADERLVACPTYKPKA